MKDLCRIMAACLLVSGLLITSAGVEAAPPAFSTAGGPDMRAAVPAPGMFLVSARKLHDRHFRKSVIYILRHDDRGTLGLIINKPGSLPLSRAVDNINTEHARKHLLYYGGPVGTSEITMLIDNVPESPLVEHVAGDVYYSNQRIIMERLLEERKPASKLHFFHGHAGWMAGQLEHELSRGDWHLIEGNTRSIFSPEIRSLWHRLIRKLEPLGMIVRATTLPAPQSN